MHGVELTEDEFAKFRGLIYGSPGSGSPRRSG